jgi:hypothetical protein
MTEGSIVLSFLAEEDKARVFLGLYLTFRETWMVVGHSSIRLLSCYLQR